MSTATRARTAIACSARLFTEQGSSASGDWFSSSGLIPDGAIVRSKAAGWDGGAAWQTLLRIVDDEAPGLEAPFLG